VSETDDPAALARLVGREMYARDSTAQYLGIQLEDVGAGWARMQMKVRSEMANGHGICHGGFIFTLGDTTFAYACNSHNHNTVASGCSIDYLAPALVGDTLHAVAEERALSGRTGVYDIEISNQDGKRIAFFRGRSYRIKGMVVALAPRQGPGPD
jgi:acyl-CoA thioesterase